MHISSKEKHQLALKIDNISQLEYEKCERENNPKLIKKLRDKPYALKYQEKLKEIKSNEIKRD